ncbi:asparagine synthase (glutamine-hydrolyzing) [Chromobacterium sp. ATCC 53434]|uniref:asparagine synthase (glutamine-hydrolyzing) n=1 Tax=Chromobacterium sp. (strain ATCC 53434 / SC 14030) TaxID=2059672 RepID=UPI000C777013|nr:asparagine synthase (glutamine-hydrolyzing) [Chromobacterium sp. ATCC 53434]AUH51817.1 asparagine synthase (glutamine-hydrolyzing) [Chromobacterium sp. ATCC 53434]
MCGIAGWVSFERDLTRYREVAERMTRTMEKRGPDAEGLWLDRRAAMGHRRLSIIDLEGGRQPMLADEDGRTLACLVYTGEVYNFQELRRELEGLGHAFRTRSDTEVVLRAYLQWGEALTARLNGMYAFAVWDARAERLLLVRDRMGVKPLYYYQTADGVLFGSEPKAILAHPEAQRRVSADGLREMLDLVKTPEAAVFAGMREVRPGQTITVDRAGLRKHRYWQLEAREHADDLPKTIRTVRDLLDDIVERQIIADVPLCTLLSGGLDSSVITALAAKSMRRQGKGTVRSFSVDFVKHGMEFEADYLRGSPDAPFVHDLAAFAGTDHREIVLESRELADPALRAAVLGAQDLPPAYWGDMLPSLYKLFEAIRAQSTVALSGESADEVFGGYRWFHDAAAVAADTFPWLAGQSGAFFDGQSLIAPELLGELDMAGFRRDSYEQALADVPRLASDSPTERRMREISHMHLTRFVQALLDRKDRMSMAVGLEVRVPFCDHRLVEYVFNAPWSMKTFDGREKSLLRAAGRDVLPDSIVQRVKSPYPATQDPAYEQALRAGLGRVLDDASSPALPLLDKAAAWKLLDKPFGKTSTSPERAGLEMALGVNEWLLHHQVTLDL